MQTRIIDHYPPVLRQIKDIQQIAAAEEEEFRCLRDGIKGCGERQFILTADGDGLSYFESVLGITPQRRDSIEERRARVLEKWYNRMPYTKRLLLKKMEALCRGQAFSVEVPDGEYGVKVSVEIEPGMEPVLTEVQQMLEGFLPLNLYFDLTGAVRRMRRTGLYIGSAGAVNLKIKARPQKRDSYIKRETRLFTGIGTMGLIRISYRPGKE